MKQRLQQLAARIDALSLRERVLVLLAVVILLFTLWNQVLMGPLERSQRDLQSQADQARSDIERLERQIAELSTSSELDPDRDNRARKTQLETEIADIDERLRERTDALIAPTAMARMLEEILTRETDLRLVRIENLPRTPLLEAADGKTATASEPAPGIYRHGIRIEFVGGYMSTLRYLRALEALPWRFFWDGVEYRVEEYPNARVTITVHTLGLREGWIGV